MIEYRQEGLYQQQLPFWQDDVFDEFTRRQEKETRRTRRLFDPMYDRPPLNRAERREQGRRVNRLRRRK